MKRNSKGVSWKEHAAPHLRAALKKAAASWKPKSERTNVAKVKKLQSQRAKINAEIRREKGK